MSKFVTLYILANIVIGLVLGYLIVRGKADSIRTDIINQEKKDVYCSQYCFEKTEIFTKEEYQIQCLATRCNTQTGDMCIMKITSISSCYLIN